MYPILWLMMASLYPVLTLYMMSRSICAMYMPKLFRCGRYMIPFHAIGVRIPVILSTPRGILTHVFYIQLSASSLELSMSAKY